MSLNRCEAIVIGVMDYREADRIVTLFSREQGKLRCIARGAKRSMKRFGGGLELFARLDTELRLREGLVPLGSVDIITIYPGIRTDLYKIAHAGYVCELTERLLPEGLRNPRYYRLLTSYLEHLQGHPWEESDRRLFEVNLLNILGYRLPLEECCCCGSPLAGAHGVRFDRAMAAFNCSSCSGPGLPISAATLASLARAMTTGRFGTVNFPSPQLQEAGVMLDTVLAAHLDRPLRSLAFLQGVGE